MTKTDTTRRDAYQEVTDKLIAAMESGTAPWASPYTCGGLALSMSTNKAYRGINALLLGIEADLKGYESRWWGTYKKVQELGGQVRKGEHGTLITFWKRLVKEQVDATTGETSRKQIFFLRFYTVFNAEQADGLPTRFCQVERPAYEKRIEAAETIMLHYVNGPAVVSHDQTMAWYAPATDTVNVPRPENITSPDAWYATVFHELTHSTGHTSRLSREGITTLVKHRRGELYAFEELVAEMGSAILCAHAGIDSTFDNSAAYLRGWISFLRSDGKAAVRAAAQAQRAADHILGVEYSDNSEEMAA
jgi:antirestriction protein ArdC